jgi:phosphoribosylamine--glycine ligase
LLIVQLTSKIKILIREIIMKSVLVVGGGGREHAIGYSVSEHVDAVFFAPGNGGTESIDNGFNIALKPSDHDQIVNFINERRIDLTIIGPEQPLIDGLADKINNHAVFGPSAEAAQLEGSKAFATIFMHKNKIPHPRTTIIDNSKILYETLDSINDNNAVDYVYKADGPAAGKGVVLPDNSSQAKQTLIGMYSGKLFNGAGKDCVLKQEKLHGPELSVFALCDGKNFQILPYVQDHKRLKDFDEGPNTGGMGAYAPVSDHLVNSDQKAKIDDIVLKTIKGTQEWKVPYKGVIFIGVMLAKERDNDPVVIEYNVRFGDPEAQVLFPLMQNAGINTYELLKSTAEGSMRPRTIRNLGGAALTICMAAEGYPNNPKTDDVIYGLDGKYNDILIQHGATSYKDDKIVTAGGRVLYITGLGNDIKTASANAKAAIGEHGVHFPGMQHRNDIGQQALSA